MCYKGIITLLSIVFAVTVFFNDGTEKTFEDANFVYSYASGDQLVYVELFAEGDVTTGGYGNMKDKVAVINGKDIKAIVVKRWEKK